MRRNFHRYIHKTLSQNIRPVLQEANFAIDKGEYSRAAGLVECLDQVTAPCACCGSPLR